MGTEHCSDHMGWSHTTREIWLPNIHWTLQGPVGHLPAPCRCCRHAKPSKI